MKKSVLILLAISSFTPSAFAALSSGSCTDAQKASVVTRHVTQIAGKTIAYTATAGFLEVNSADQSSKACIFYTSYVVGSDHTRPITFAFNGGPGSASLWLHLGLLGPKRVDMGMDGLTLPRGPGLIVNDYSPLDVTDIVMIDPVATGFSNAEDPAASGTDDKFFGVKNDYRSIESFIQNFILTYDRWSSPKYILGESYGGIRGSLLANHLQSDLSIAINGLILISPALSSTSFMFESTDNNVPFWTFFPSYATTAWYHKKLAPELQALDVSTVYDQAKAFADTVYRDALDRGNAMDSKDFHSMAKQVSSWTGLSQGFVEWFRLKVSPDEIFSNLLSSEKLFVGRYDSRFVSPRLPDGEDSDPSSTLVGYPYTEAINGYLRDELGFHLESPYVNFGNVWPWPSDSSHGSWPNVMDDLTQALAQNPNFHVMIASGYFDLACPMGTVSYEISQMSGDPNLAARIEHKRFFGGHMMYINPSALKQLKDDIAAFITQDSLKSGLRN